MATQPEAETEYLVLDRTPTSGEESEFFRNEAERAVVIM